MERKKNRSATPVDPTQSQGVHAIMSHSTDTAGPCVVLHTVKGERVLFGHVTEGTQRAILEQKFKLSKLSGIYLTGPISWGTVSGLAGFLLTLVSSGKTALDLRSCGLNVDWICATWRHFVFHKTMGIKTDRMLKGYVTDEVNIGGVLVSPSRCGSKTPEASQEPKEHKEPKNHRNLQPLNPNAPWSNVSSVLKVMFGTFGQEYGYDKTQLKKQSDTNLPGVPKDERSTCYIVQVHRKPGKFNPKAAAKLNIPKNMFKFLHKGEDVTLEDGTVIKPESCVDTPQHYGRILFVDLPDSRYVDGVVSCPEWTRAYDSRVAQPVYGSGQKRNSQEMEGVEQESHTDADSVPEPYVSTVYHFFGPEMEAYFAGDSPEKYFAWMESLGPDVLHIVSAPWLDNQELTFRGAAHLSWKLRQSLGDMFPAPLSNYRTLTDSRSDFVADPELSQRLHMRLLRKGDTAAIEPSRSGPTRIFQTSMKEYQGLDEQVTTVVDRESATGASLKSRAELLTLGTGSACPSKYRNVAGLIMRVPRPDGTFTGVVMDCGEGTYGTLTRMYSTAGCEQVLREIKMLYVSHLHADHHLGTPSFICEWIKANPGDSKLQIVAPQIYKRFLEECANFDQHMRSRVEFFGCWSFMDKFRQGNLVLPDVPGLTNIKTCYAHHCDQSFCVEFSFDLGDGAAAGTEAAAAASDDEILRFAYSGDTRPIRAFSEMAKGCDLVVHEATLDNDLPLEAIAKRHCTFSEALSVCDKMDAKHVVLTHFSQRYPKLPELGSMSLVKESGEKVPVAIAFDMMRIRISEIDQQADHFAAISEALSETKEAEEVDEAGEKE